MLIYSRLLKPNRGKRRAAVPISTTRNNPVLSPAGMHDVTNVQSPKETKADRCGAGNQHMYTVVMHVT